MKPTHQKEKHEAWAISEAKLTLLTLFQKYTEYRAEFNNSVNAKMSDPIIAQCNVIATLDAYFQLCQAPFIPHILDNETYIMSVLEEMGVSKEECSSADQLRIKYQTLPLYGMKYSKELLFVMGNILNEYNTSKGYLRMLESTPIYESYEDKMKAILDEEEN